VEEYYFVKRETLKILIKILSKEEMFSKFRDFYLSSIDNLKIVMSLLNHSCVRIKFKAIQLLYFFFVDLDLREKNVKSLLLANKNNFENYFDRLQENDTDILEKKTYILYELERLQNMG
jgi:hypothetical protein